MGAPDDADVSSSLARAHRGLDEADSLLDRLRALLQDAAGAVNEARTVVNDEEDDRARG